MEQWRKDARKEAIITDIDSLVPADHLLRKIEKVMDYEWIYERLDPYYNHNNGRPGTGCKAVRIQADGLPLGKRYKMPVLRSWRRIGRGINPRK